MNWIKIPDETGTIAFEDDGNGPLLLCIPGMGESTKIFSHFRKIMVKAGFRVVAMDLRGHGESSATFTTYGDEATAADIITLLTYLNTGAACVVGNSMGAAAGVITASKRPDLVTRLVLIGPFVREHGTAISRFFTRALLSRPWGPAAWRWYYLSLFGTRIHSDQDAHTSRALSLLQRPGRWKAFQKTAKTQHKESESLLGSLQVPTLTIMGSKDKDFPNPESEAMLISDITGGSYVMIEDAGHYPMFEQPDVTANKILSFVEGMKAA